MLGNLKTLGRVLLVVGAISAAGAPVAAATETYTSGVGTGIRTFSSGDKTTNHVFTTPNGTVVCTNLGFLGETVQTGPTITEITVTPTFSGCSAFGFTAHVINNGCDFLFTAPTTVTSSEWTIHPAHIVPSSGSSCTFSVTPTFFGASVCTQTIPNQTPTGGHVIGKNSAAGTTPMDGTLESKISGIHYSGSGGVCGDASTHSDGGYTGGVTVTCFSDAARTVAVDCTLG
jgi:hypothetical protein